MSAVMPVTVYVPRDSAALALGADEVAAAIASEAAQRGYRHPTGTQLVARHVLAGADGRSGDRAGTDGLRPGWRPEDVSGLFDAGFLSGAAHPLTHGLTDEIPYLKQQERLTFARRRHYRSGLARRLSGA